MASVTNDLTMGAFGSDDLTHNFVGPVDVEVSMNCWKCGGAVDAKAMFCMHCGAALHAQPPGVQATAPQIQPPTHVPAPDIPSRRNWLVPAIIGALAILAVGLGLNMAGILKFGGSQSGSGLQAGRDHDPNAGLAATGEEKNDPGLVATGSPERPITPSVDQAKRMPDEIRRYLEHVERTERRREEISFKILGVMSKYLVELKTMGGMGGLLSGDESRESPEGGDLEPSRMTGEEFEKVRQDWLALTNDFNSVKPPSECVSLRNSYDQALRETASMTLDLIEVLNMASSDPSGALTKAQSMQGKSGDRIDVAAEESDRKVGEICEKYETRKWFAIKKDIGNGGILKGMGF